MGFTVKFWQYSAIFKVLGFCPCAGSRQPSKWLGFARAPVALILIKGIRKCFMFLKVPTARVLNRSIDFDLGIQWRGDLLITKEIS